MTTPKAQTNKKWISSKDYKKGFDRTFRERLAEISCDISEDSWCRKGAGCFYCPERKTPLGRIKGE